MSQTFEYLLYFGAYGLIMLFIGKSSFKESDSIYKVFVGERRTGFWRLFFTFVGTWISAATILGFPGNVYMSGTQVIAFTVIPWFIGTGMLCAISGKIYDCKILTIPQLIGDRYGSRMLRIVCALLLSGGYVFYLVMQIKGFGIAAARLLNLDYKAVIFLVYLFILYSTFGGFYSVSKSDGFNLVILTVSTGIVYLAVIRQVGGGFLLSDGMVRDQVLPAGDLSQAGYLEKGGLLLYLSMFFGWGMGLATNPQYLIRIVAAKDGRTAKRVLLFSLVFLAAFYFCLTQIGLGLRILFPALAGICGPDEIFVRAVGYLVDSRASGLFLLSVIGACISTANSQLLLIGSMMSYDVAAQLGRWKRTEDRILTLTNVFIFAGGTLALIIAMNPPQNILFFGADIWGLFAAFLTPLIYGTLYYGRGTKKGAWGALFAGLGGALVFSRLNLPVYWAFPATLCSTAAYLLIPFLEAAAARRRERGKEGTGV